MKNQLYIFPGGSDGKVSAYNVGDLGSILGWEDLLEKAMATHSSILAWKSHGRRNLVGSSPWVMQSQTRLSDFMNKTLPS